MNEKDIRKIIGESKSKSQAAIGLGFKINGYGLKRVKILIDQYDIDISHFDVHWYSKEKRNIRIKKECPICGNVFEVEVNNKKGKITCSHSCANTYFRSGENHGNWKEDSYRTTCFEFHKKECVVCGENKIVEVHHYDGNHENNKKENLVPICSTHHKYWHSRYRYLIKDKVDNYVKDFIKHGGFGVIG